MGFGPRPMIAQGGVLPRIGVGCAWQQKKGEVQQLLKDYRAYHTPYGNARELNLESMDQ
jgi:hypothetical protein